MIAALLLGLALQQAPAAAQPAPAAKATVEGIVVHAATGEPLRKAQVSLNRAGSNGAAAAVATDGSGRFAFSVEAASYRLSAERNGFVRQELGAKRPGRAGAALVLSPGEMVRDVKLALTPQSAITGRVVDEDGEPLSGISVQTVRQVYSRGRREWVPTGAATTNDLGEYRIHGLAPGRYFLAATNRVNRVRSDEGYPPLYFPGALDPASAAPIELNPGGVFSGADFTLRRVQTGRIRGRVTGSPGRRVAVMLAPSTGSFVRFTPGDRASSVDSEGNFEIRGVLPGSYAVSARSAENGRMQGTSRIVQVTSGNITDVELSMGSGMELKGAIKMEGDAALAARVYVSLTPDELPALGMQNVRTQADGRFSLANVASARYQVNVSSLPPGAYVKSIKMGDVDVLANGIDLSEGGAADALEIVLSLAAAQLQGVVFTADTKGAQGSTVVLVPDESRRNRTSLYRTATTDHMGRFSMQGVPPGDYKIFAWDDIDNGIWYEPDFMRAQESNGQTLKLSESARETLQLKLIRSN